MAARRGTSQGKGNGQRASTRKRAGDTTGRVAEKQAKEAAEEGKIRDDITTLTQQAKVAESDEIIDTTGEGVTEEDTATYIDPDEHDVEDVTHVAEAAGSLVGAEAEEVEVADDADPEELAEEIDWTEDEDDETVDSAAIVQETLAPPSVAQAIPVPMTPAEGPPQIVQGTEVVRILEDLPNFTFGPHQQYSFDEGRKYKVTNDVASHLREKGVAV
jgi:hypothetical protein